MIQYNQNDPSFQVFLQEFEEMQAHLETNILELETQANDPRLVDKIFRDMHTIKGGAGMVSWKDLADYTHIVENLLVKVREGKIPVTKDLVTVLLESLDCLKSFLLEAKGEGQADQPLAQRNLVKVEAFTKPKSKSKESSSEPSTTENPIPIKSEHVAVQVRDKAPILTTYLIQLKFNPDFLAKGTDPLPILNDLVQLGHATVIPHIADIPLLDQLIPQEIHLWWDILLETSQPFTKIEEILMFLNDHKEILIQTPSEIPLAPENQAQIDAEVVLPVVNNKTEAVSESPTITDSIRSTASLQQTNAASAQEEEEEETAPPPLSTTGFQSSTQVSPVANTAPATNAPKTEVQTESKTTASIRVDISKLDQLINLVGETVINQSRLFQLYTDLESVHGDFAERLMRILNDSDRTIRELQNRIMNVRMIPIGGTFMPLQRIVRDFCAQSGKYIQLQILGGDAEIDKTIAEQLSGALKHLIRNALDHGIEMPEQRLAKGKPELGTVTLNAFHQAGRIVIEMKDDGAGINVDKIKQIAVIRGLVKEESILSDNEILDLICAPGFSTAEKVTDISGRGVGMDAVKRSIEELHGLLEISTVLGQSTTFCIKLPLTLAIIEGMLVEVGQSMFTIPILSVVESLKPTTQHLKTIRGKGEMIDVRGESIPLLRLHRIFNILPKFDDPLQALVVIVEYKGSKYSLLVDHMHDQQQIVIKSLEENFRQLPGITGATILGDGRVSLILDIPGLIQKYY